MGSAPSPQSSQTNAEEQAYLDKLQQLRKYIEPLKRMVAKIEKEEGLCLPPKRTGRLYVCHLYAETK